MAIGYKLFKIKKSEKGKLFPLYVYANEELPMGEWLEAKDGEQRDGKVVSKLGLLKYRPGFHINDKVPYVSHIGVKEDGIIKYMHPDTVWAEVEYSDNIDYSEQAKANGIINGKYIPKKACLDSIPVDGYYRYKTNPNMTGEWIIAGGMKINRILSDEEVSQICKKNGFEALPRTDGFDLRSYGFVV